MQRVTFQVESGKVAVNAALPEDKRLRTASLFLSAV